jgi:hypothetical protein
MANRVVAGGDASSMLDGVVPPFADVVSRKAMVSTWVGGRRRVAVAVLDGPFGAE